MKEKLRQRLEKVEKDLNWSGLDPQDMRTITAYTLEALKDHITETEPSATGEINDLSTIIDLIYTFFKD